MILNLRELGVGQAGAPKTTPMLSKPGKHTFKEFYELSTSYPHGIHADWKGAGPKFKIKTKKEEPAPETPKAPPDTTFGHLSQQEAFHKYMKHRDEEGNLQDPSLLADQNDQPTRIEAPQYAPHDNKSQRETANFKSVERDYYASLAENVSVLKH